MLTTPRLRAFLLVSGLALGAALLPLASVGFRTPDAHEAAPEESERDGTREEFHHPNGIADFLTKLVAQRKKPAIHPVAFTYEREGDPRIEVALQWTEGTDELIKSYANGIPTTNGGTHENGFKQAVNKAIRGYMDAHNIAPKGLKIVAEDIREGVVALVSAYVSEPQFQGQTKDRLNNAEVTAPIENAVRTALEQSLGKTDFALGTPSLDPTACTLYFSSDGDPDDADWDVYRSPR